MHLDRVRSPPLHRRVGRVRAERGDERARCVGRAERLVPRAVAERDVGDELGELELRCDARRCEAMRGDARRCEAMRCDAMRRHEGDAR